jgi:excinuclease ABC subunit B
VIDESHVAVPQAGGMYRGDRARKTTLVDYGFRLPSALDNRPLKFDEFESLQRQVLFVSATPGAYELQKSGERVVELVVRPTGLVDPPVEVRPAAKGQVDDLLSAKCGSASAEAAARAGHHADQADGRGPHRLPAANLGVKVRYLHSDIDSLERVEIIRDLRLACSMCWSASTCCARASTCPKWRWSPCSMPTRRAFLRSETLADPDHAAGRRATSKGKAILYADTLTGSMQRAIDETERRRGVQLEFNRQHGITPRGIHKEVSDILEGAVAPGDRGRRGRKAQPAAAELQQLPPQQLEKAVKKLEEQMYLHARNLEFEAAARLRDQIQALRERSYGAAQR